MLIERARTFAIAAHTAVGQVRKHTGEPYWRHPQRVVNLVLAHSEKTTLEQIAAAWLHDVVEDTKVELHDIATHFGTDTTRMVDALTDCDRSLGNRRERQELNNNRLGRASGLVHSIKLADIIDNVPSIVEHDPDFAKVYLSEKRRQLAVLDQGSPTLWGMALSIINGTRAAA